MTRTTSMDVTYTRPAFSLGAWLSGGFNMPTETQFKAASEDPGIDQGMPKGFFGRLGVWLGGGYNLPTKAQFEAAPDTVVEKPTYLTGWRGWLSGGFNNPIENQTRR